MGKPGTKNPRSAAAWRVHAVLLPLFTLLLAALHAQTRATSVPLLLPAGLALDAQGNLYLAQQTGHQVLLVNSAGVLTRYAGNGVQGYRGDGGPALAAELDSPSALALSPSGDLYLADTHNHRIRRVSAGTGIISPVAGTGVPGNAADGLPAASSPVDSPVALAFDPAGNLFFADARTHRVRRIDSGTGLLSTVAGSGVQGFSGDGGPARAAALDTPSGLAMTPAGALLIADAHNSRIRRVDPATGVITTVAGTGVASFAGENGQATGAALRLPRGLTADAAGNLFLADSGNGRIRRIDAVTGVITTVAGGPVQRFAGDGSPAVSASLDSPRAVALAPGGLVTLADSANGRVRQVDSQAVIHTIAGLGATEGSVLTLTAPSVTGYGSGTVVASLGASPATGSVTLLEISGTQLITLGTTPLTANAAAFSSAALPAGSYQLMATYPGDDLHAAAQSGVLTLTVAPAAAVATPAPVSLAYGQPVPMLGGTLAGVLPADQPLITLVLATAATAQSPPAVYPITGALAGPAAANYALTTQPAAVTINKAAATVVLTTANAVSAHVTSTTSGTPTGTVSLLDGSQTVASAPLSAGFAVFAPVLTAGAHTLTAAYAGDTDFLPATSAPTVLSISPGPTPDFTLAAAGASTQTIPAGTAASFAFTVSLTNGGPPSAIQFSVTGLPAGATASFNPAYLPPGGAVTSTILTVQTAHAQNLQGPFRRLAPVLAMLLPVLLLGWRRAPVRRGCLFLGAAAMLLAATACGDRVSTAGQATPAKPYPLLVTGTAVNAAGNTLQHSAGVTLNVQ